MGYTDVQSAGNSGTGSSLTVTLGSATVAGNLIWVLVGSGTPTSVTDNVGNTYTLQDSLSLSSAKGYVYDCVGSTGGATSITANFSSATPAEMIVREFSGTTGSFDVKGHNSAS